MNTESCEISVSEDGVTTEYIHAASMDGFTPYHDNGRLASTPLCRPPYMKQKFVPQLIHKETRQGVTTYDSSRVGYRPLSFPLPIYSQTNLSYLSETRKPSAAVKQRSKRMPGRFYMQSLTTLFNEPSPLWMRATSPR